MSTRLFFLVGAVLSVAWAQSATIFPVALGPDANLQGEIIGSGGDVGTTFVLSGETRGITFTLTLAEDATRVSERVSIPTRSYDISVGCVVSEGSAVCENVVVSHGVTNTLEPTTLPFSPFPIPVRTSGVSRETGTGTGTVTGSASASHSSADSSSTRVPSSVTNASSTASTSALSSSSVVNASSVHSSAPSVTSSVSVSIASAPPTFSSTSSSGPVAVSSSLTHQSSIPASSAAASPTAIGPGGPAATVASPSASQSSASDGSKSFTVNTGLILSFVVTLCYLG